MATVDDVREQKAHAADLAAQERAEASVRNIGVQSPGFIRATHPEHGEPVVFCPGEMLPEWAADALNGGRGQFDAATGVFMLDEPAPRKGRRS